MAISSAAGVRDGTPDINDTATTITRSTDGSESTEISIAEEQDRKARERNLVIRNLPFHQNEDTSKAVFDNVLNKMHVIPKPKFRAFRLGHGSPGRPAPILVQFQDDLHRTALQSRKLVMQNKFKMKGTRIWISPDLTAKQRQALRVERQKVILARKQRLRCELREGVATHLVPLRKQAHASMNKGKQVIQSKPLSDQRATETEGIEVMVMDLPEHLVEKIIAMLPFPAIFKARCLSKSWQLRFSSVANLENGENKRHAIYFQNLVGEYSHNWKSIYWPVLKDDSGRVDAEDLGEDWFENLDKRWARSCVAYDRSSRKWQRLPFPPCPLSGSDLRLDRVQIDGAVWHWWAEFNRLLVVNVFTGSWKLLPAVPGSSRNSLGIWEKLVMHASSEYQVILFCDNRNVDDEEFTCGCVFHIYDSKSESWTTGKRFVIPSCFLKDASSKEYLNGVLYMVLCYGSSNAVRGDLRALDLEKGTIEELQLPTLDKPDYYAELQPCRYEEHEWDHVNQDPLCYRTLVVCNGNLLMVTQESFSNWIRSWRDNGSYAAHRHHLRVLEIDVGSGVVSEVAHIREGKRRWNLEETVSDGKSILFKSSEMKQGVLEYNVEKRWWRSFPFEYDVPPNICWSSNLSLGERGQGPFQPALNTFAVV